MKKNPKRLVLNRETLRILEAGLFRRVVGGCTDGSCWLTLSQHTECNTDCPYCPTDILTDCC